jgi:hypothetical protein
MNRFAPFFNKKVFVVALVLDLAIGIVFTVGHAALHHIQLFSGVMGKIFVSSLVFGYVFVLLVFFILFLINNPKNN